MHRTAIDSHRGLRLLSVLLNRCLKLLIAHSYSWQTPVLSYLAWCCFTAKDGLRFALQLFSPWICRRWHHHLLVLDLILSHRSQTCDLWNCHLLEVLRCVDEKASVFSLEFGIGRCSQFHAFSSSILSCGPKLQYSSFQWHFNQTSVNTVISPMCLAKSDPSYPPLYASSAIFHDFVSLRSFAGLTFVAQLGILDLLTLMFHSFKCLCLAGIHDFNGF